MVQHETLSLTPQQTQLIALLVNGATINAAAKTLQVNESTCRRWLKLTQVDKAYRAAKHDKANYVLEELYNQGLDALRRHIMADVQPTPQSQMRVFELIIELVLEQVDSIDMIESLKQEARALECRLKRENKANE